MSFVGEELRAGELSEGPTKLLGGRRALRKPSEIWKISKELYAHREKKN